MKSEEVTAWGCRLEDLLDRAMEHKSVPINDVNEMLRSRFWNGLNQRLKDGSRHKFDTVADFDKLRKEIRAIEKEHQLTDELETSQQQRKAQAKMTTASVDDSDSAFKKLESVVSQLSKQVEVMQQYAAGRGQGVSGQGVAPQAGGWQGGGWPGGRGQAGPRQGNPAGQPGVQPPPGFQPPVAGNPQPQQFPPQQPRFSQDVRQQGCFNCGEFGHLRPECPRRFEPTCWKCGRLGHRHQNCHDLNFQNPLLKGGQ